MDEFTVDWGDDFVDPVWGQGNYRVLEHFEEYAFIYKRPDDNVIKFIVWSFAMYQSDFVLYFPQGLDSSTIEGI